MAGNLLKIALLHSLYIIAHEPGLATVYHGLKVIDSVTLLYTVWVSAM